MKSKFNKTEKGTCQFYQWGKCLAQEEGKRDCRPLKENGTFPDKIEDCQFFKVKE